MKKRYVEIEIPGESDDMNISKDIDVPLEVYGDQPLEILNDIVSYEEWKL